MHGSAPEPHVIRHHKSPAASAFSEGDGHAMERIVDGVSQELACMQSLLGDHSDARAFLTMEDWAHSTIRRIADLVAEGTICPRIDARLRLGRRSRSFDRPFRLGVFPIAGNPLHWLHVFSGLAAMERLQLDKVIYVVAGADPRKPTLASEQVRHCMAKKVLGLFSPLLEYSAIARGSATVGEENLFRIVSTANIEALHLFYIAGSDHYRRVAPSGDDSDTIQKLEKGIRRRTHGFNPRRHQLSAVFLDRGGYIEHVDTFLDVRWINDLPLHTSSTRIRGAFTGEQELSELSFLPYSAYGVICASGLYGMSLEGQEGNLQEGASVS